LRIIEIRALRGYIVPNREEIKGDWIKLHNGSFSNFCSPPHCVRTVTSGRRGYFRHAACMDPMINAFIFGKPEGKRQLGRPCYRRD